MSRLCSLAGLVFALAVTPLASAEGRPSVGDLVSAIVDEYGGLETLQRVRSYRVRGQLTAIQWKTTAHTERAFERPDRLRIDLQYPDRTEIRITHGARGWKGASESSLIEAVDPMLQSMRLQTARFDLPLRLLEQIERLSLMESDEEGRFVLRLPLEDTMHVDYHVDPSSHRIESITMTMAGPPPITFRADLSQFHEIEGVLFPLREVTSAGSTPTSEFSATDFELNPKIPWNEMLPAASLD